MTQQLERLALVAHYVIARADPSELGTARLNKILWLADVEHYRLYGRSITGLDAYTRMPDGPVPDGITAALSLLKRSGRIAERTAPLYGRRELVWLRAPDLSEFDAPAVDTLNQVIERVRRQPAAFVSDVTHDDPLWQELEDGEPMPVRAGAVVTRTPRPRELAWARAQESE